MAATSQALVRGLGFVPDTRAHMKAILLTFAVKFGEFYSSLDSLAWAARSISALIAPPIRNANPVT
jgi:hypothetical protein